MGRREGEPVRKKTGDRVVALAGNPNVGKSTLFNALTGLHQHTGNWPGKTVAVAWGRCVRHGAGYVLVDLPGTYSLLQDSQEEAVATGFLLDGSADCVVVVCDATRLSRSLVLALQVLEVTDRAVVCVNLLDEAERQGLAVDLRALQRQLGVPVVGTSAGRKRGLGTVLDRVQAVLDCTSMARPVENSADRLARLQGNSQAASDEIAAALVARAEALANEALLDTGETKAGRRQRRLDRFLLGWGGIPAALGLLLVVFWLTIQGANVPSQYLQRAFDALGVWLWRGADRLGLPQWLSSPLLDGMYATAARVVAVMLPPMAIFFPLFTLLEDLGYLPRVAFTMDHAFCRCGACGKQALTMCMGFGCNACGVVGCRIIASPRERLLAMVTNAMVPCNGRFPTLIVLISLFFAQGLGGLTASLMLTGLVLLGVAGTLLSSKALSGTVLKGVPSAFALELPPYRRPQLGKILVRSILDRTAYVLGRAVLVAAPAGLVIWVLANVAPSGVSLLARLSGGLDPLGRALGMNGVILAAFLLGLPANELVLPMIVMMLTRGGVLTDVSDTAALGVLLQADGWTWLTALCTMVFTVFHWPCATTCLTIRRESGSWRWTALAVLLPTVIGVVLCAALRLVFG